VAAPTIVTKPAQCKLRGLLSATAGAPESWRACVVQLAFLAGLMNVSGCATLPDVDSKMAEPHARRVSFEDANGPVSVARGAAILERLAGKDAASEILQKHLAYEQAINADSPLVLGNQLTLLQNGPATYQAMFAAIGAAKDSINLETYIFDDDESGRQFATLLLERQAAGVQVNIIRDSIGGINTPAAFYDRLRAGGIQLLEFNPVNPLAGNLKAWLLNNRDHRRQLVVDGRIAFTGGINISDTYSSAPIARRARKRQAQPTQPVTGWRDTHLRIEGPVVAEFQRLFMETWTRQKGEPLAARNYFPALEKQGNEIVRAIGSTPTAGDNRSVIYLTLLSAISRAELSVHLTVAYFAPDPQLRKALTDAARRGVMVKLVLPSYSDSSAIFHLGRSYYTELLRAGVMIHERHGAVMHAKTACIDGVWSTIGSTNLDWRSFLHNDELNAVILGRGFATQMDDMFAADLLESDTVTLYRWKQRSRLLRWKERAARIAAFWL
jgi:cardiolipin synthase A/B